MIAKNNFLKNFNSGVVALGIVHAIAITLIFKFLQSDYELLGLNSIILGLFWFAICFILTILFETKDFHVFCWVAILVSLIAFVLGAFAFLNEATEGETLMITAPGFIYGAALGKNIGILIRKLTAKA